MDINLTESINSENTRTLTRVQRFEKRLIDVCVSSIGLIVVAPIIAIAWLAATISTRKNGFFLQIRIGREGRPFRLIKIRTMKSVAGFATTVTTQHDPRITNLGTFLRKTKIDELPQLINVFLGQMSLVGPRPDVAGFADQLTGDDRIVLTVRPGITGPASLEFRNEEQLLAKQADPEIYNREVIWPRKVAINRNYVENWTLGVDLLCLWQTIFGSTRSQP